MKNQARTKAVAMCRSIAMRLKVDPTLTDLEKVSFGLHLNSALAQAAKLPKGAHPGMVGFPSLTVRNSPNGGHVIFYSDKTSELKRKPKGVSHLLLFAAIGEKPKMRPTHARLLGAYTKRPFEIMYPAGCGLEGLYVTYYGRWLTTRGEMSPFSPGVSVIIGGTRASLGDVDFAHLFGREGFVDALPGLPEGAERHVLDDHPLLENTAIEQDELAAALEATMLPWRALAFTTERPTTAEENWLDTA
jgi:hypothetical protein